MDAGQTKRPWALGPRKLVDWLANGKALELIQTLETKDYVESWLAK